MQKIILDKKTFFWKKKLNLEFNKNKLLDLVNDTIKNKKSNGRDVYSIVTIKDDLNFTGELPFKNELSDIIKICIENCKKIFIEEFKKEFNKIEIGSWINVVRSSNPVQFLDFPMNGLEKYHSHTIINEKNGSFIPDLTFVYYIQMPNILKGDDGVLYILGDNQVEHKFLPEENDLIIMPGDLPHAPNNAPLSNIDRIVIAGNIGFQHIKKEKTLF